MTMALFDIVESLPPNGDYVRILPEIVLSIFGMIIMVVDPVVDERRSQRTLGIVALIGAVAGLAATLYQSQQHFWGLAFWQMIKVDGFSVFFHFVVAAVTVLVILSSYEYMEVQQIRAGEYYGLILFGAVGMMLMSSAVELVLIFIALEISSISTYILAGFRRRSAISSEASVKYFLLGSFATAFFLYGVALMFGATGSTSIDKIGEALGQYTNGGGPILAYIGVALMFVGLGFKVAAAPFHVWTPDVYEGAPAPVVGFMSTAPKAAVFAVLLRVQHRRSGSRQRETPAGVLVYRARGIFVNGVCRVAAVGPEKWDICGNVLHRFVCGHERGRIRRCRTLRGRRRALRDPGGLFGPGQTFARFGRHLHNFSAIADRHSGVWGILCEGLCIHLGDEPEPHWTAANRRFE